MAARRDMLEIGFFTLPFFLYGGIAAQTGGLYLWAVLLPLFLMACRGPNLRAGDGRHLLLLGTCFLGVWALFPLSNFLNINSSLPLIELEGAAATSLITASRELSLGELLKSKMPSSWLISGVFLMITALVGLLRKVGPANEALQLAGQGQQRSPGQRQGSSDFAGRRPRDSQGSQKRWGPQHQRKLESQRYQGGQRGHYRQRGQQSPRGSEHGSQQRSGGAGSKNLVAAFAWGSLVASVLFGVYALVQYVTGFDYREPASQLGAHRLLGDSTFFRVSGFYGHPLSLAAVALAQVGFFTYLAVTAVMVSNSKQKVASGLIGWLQLAASRRCLVACAALNLAFVLMSGGRTAACLALLTVVGLLLMTLGRRLPARYAVAWGLAIVVTAALAVYGSGLFGRVLELAEHLQEGGGGGDAAGIGRISFWRVHAHIFADFPLFGRGAAHLSNGVRELYYVAAGLGSQTEKYNAHNIYLEVLASVGLVGSVVGLSLLFYMLRLLKNLQRFAKAGPGPLLQAFLFSVGLNAMHGMSQNTFFDASVIAVYLSFFWLFVWQMRLVTGPRLET